MRKIFILILALTFLYSCEKDNDTTTELNITLKSSQKSVSGIVNSSSNTTIEIFPNPFLNALNIRFSNMVSCEVFIYNLEGSGKKFKIEETISLNIDFSDESDGAYIIEILIDGTVFREFVIKDS